MSAGPHGSTALPRACWTERTVAGRSPHVIRLTRLRATDPFYVNPDQIERVEQLHDTTLVHLVNGTEFIVTDSPESIVDQVVAFRARVIDAAARVASGILP